MGFIAVVSWEWLLLSFFFHRSNFFKLRQIVDFMGGSVDV